MSLCLLSVLLSTVKGQVCVCQFPTIFFVASCEKFFKIPFQGDSNVGFQILKFVFKQIASRSLFFLIVIPNCNPFCCTANSLVIYQGFSTNWQIFEATSKKVKTSSLAKICRSSRANPQQKCLGASKVKIRQAEVVFQRK